VKHTSTKKEQNWASLREISFCARCSC